MNRFPDYLNNPAYTAHCEAQRLRYRDEAERWRRLELIRAARADGRTYDDIADELGISRSRVCQLARSI